MVGHAKDFRRRLLAWYTRTRRDLPWRVAPDAPRGALPDAYHVLVSEAMLQQTQVATVIPYFLRFIERFGSILALAQSDEQDVLRLWQGLGYYSRARNLRQAARHVVERFEGRIPGDVESLMSLPGVGRYTAGAIASLAFDNPAPILDGNVIRVLSRIDAVEADPRTPAVREALWARAGELLPKKRCCDFSSALMELGATLCTPKSPACLLCPVREHCAARAIGSQEQIPPPRPTRARPIERRLTLCLTDGERYLLEQRPATGRWAGMWQFTTFADDGLEPTPRRASELCGVQVKRLEALGTVEHGLTHRVYKFQAFRALIARPPADAAPRRWTTLDKLSDFPLPKPHLLIAQMLPATPKRHRPSARRT